MRNPGFDVPVKKDVKCIATALGITKVSYTVIHFIWIILSNTSKKSEYIKHMDIRAKKEHTRLLVARLYFILLMFAFAGWIWETVHVSMLAGKLVDRGFLFGPICPIYGLTMVMAYLLIGMPQKPKGILKATDGKWYQYPLYCIAAITLPTLVELVVGYGCERLFDIRLWDYSHYVVTVEGEDIPLHFMGYIALPISLIWVVLIFVVMGFFFPVLLKLVGRIPPKVTKTTAVILGAMMAVDIIASCIIALI